MDRRKIHDYEFGSEIGRGAYGRVFRATHKDGSVVAIKEISMSPDRLADTMQEIELLKKLNHANIVKYIESFNDKNYLYIVLEYMEQGALSQLKDKCGVLREEVISNCISKVLHGLEYLHAQGVVHRDVKGANILLGGV
jgi:serine/threonine protein kinase